MNLERCYMFNIPKILTKQLHENKNIVLDFVTHNVLVYVRVDMAPIIHEIQPFYDKVWSSI